MDSGSEDRHFLEIDRSYTDLETSRFVILPISYDETASYLKGAAAAPNAIIAASRQMETFDEVLLDEFYQCGIHTASEIDGAGVSPEKMQEKIYSAVTEYLQKDKTLISLGGEHSITPAIVKAVSQKYSDVSVLQIDSHLDLRDEYQGSRFSHACIMRRIYDMGVSAVQVGIRSFDREQYEYAKENDLKIHTPRSIAKNSDWISKVLEQLSDNVYISLDIDGLDPSIAPGTGTPEPGGLTYQQVTDLIFAVGRAKNIVAADIVEVIPNIAGVTTEYLAARLAYKIIAAAQLRK